MQSSSVSLKHVPIRSPTPPLDSSSEDLDVLSLEQELQELDNTKKPHFLDYDSIPPPGFNEQLCSIIPSTSQTIHPGEITKIDKKYETDGEISDYEFAASSMMRQHRHEKITNGCVQRIPQANQGVSDDNFNNQSKSSRKMHFLDENPIPPDYVYESESFSLDVNYGRRSENPAKHERRHSMDRAKSRKAKQQSYLLPQFLESCSSSVSHRVWPADRHHDTVSSSLDCEPKAESMYSLLSVLGYNNPFEMSAKFLELSKSPETCATLRQTRCIPLLVQMIYLESDELTKKQASMALHNVVNCHPDDKAGRREAKVLRHIEQINEYSELLKKNFNKEQGVVDESDRHPSQAMNSLMKISFDEEHRHAMCQLGALQSIACVVHYDHAVHGSHTDEQKCVLLRRYAGMALTNLTFGDGNNKALLCSNKEFMKALVAQIDTNADDLLQVTANVLRNLSWRADSTMKSVLNEIGTVTALTTAAMKNTNEGTLKAILSALWNLSAHCSTNKAEFCLVDGALSFLVDMLSYEAPSKTLSIVENAGGILRNVSSHIAVNEDFRKILRQKNCLGILLEQLKSESLTVVSNACGTLWNLSARCPEDQKYLWDNGAVPMLRSLIHSKHKMISNGSKAALKNLLNFRPAEVGTKSLDPIAKLMGLKELPTLNVRKQLALQQELDQNLSETCDNIEASPSKELKPSVDSKSLDMASGNYSHSRNKIGMVKKAMQFSDEPIASGSRTNATVTQDVVSSKEAPNHSRFSQTQKEVPYSQEEEIELDTLSNASNASSEQQDSEPGSNHQETELDQITNFSLLYAEKHHLEEAKAKGTETNLHFDDIRCYETEGTPHTILSSAGSVSDLRAEAKNHLINLHKKNIAIVECSASGSHTPERLINFCEEGTPGYISVHDSCSEDEEHGDIKNSVIAKPSQNVSQSETIKLRNEKPQVSMDTGSTTPPACEAGTAKNVTFNECLETPMMFSRQSSMESLTSIEPAMADDRSSIVSEVSRMASGIISPSELPDSPSQTIPQSPRQISSRIPSPPLTHCVQPTIVANETPLRSVFEDDLNMFGVENTPAQFSCATSLSNLSLDDEPKIVTDSLIREMKLVNHPSDEQDDVPNLQDTDNPTADSSEQVFGRNTEAGGTAEMNNTGKTEDSNDTVLSDSDDSVNDSLLLANCINIGMKGSFHAQNSEPVAPPIPPRRTSKFVKTAVSIQKDEDLSSEASDDASHDDLLEKVIRDGIQKVTTSENKLVASSSTEPVLALPRHIIKENPVKMFRKGGNPLMETVSDETNHFNVEDSPCSFSVMSALSDLTINSHRELDRNKQQPQPVLNHNADNHSLSSLSIESEDDGNLLNRIIAAGAEAKVKSTQNNEGERNAFAGKPIASNSRTVPSDSRVSNANNIEPSYICTNDSLSSIDSDLPDGNDALLQQIINVGMRKDIRPSVPAAPETPKRSQIPQQSPKRSQLPTFHNMAKHHHDRLKERERHDKQLLIDCINTGKNTKASVPHNRHLIESHMTIDKDTLQCQLDTRQKTNSKNLETTSVAVLDIISTVGASNMVPGVERSAIEGTKESELDRHQTQRSPGQQQMSCQSKSTSKAIHHIDDKNLMATNNGSNLPTNLHKSSGSSNDNELQISFTSLNLSGDTNLMELSNEYPARKLSYMEYSQDSMNNSNIGMDVSNEFLMEYSEDMPLYKIDKHKDPELMLRSVERLTFKLVSTAEYLRTNKGSQSIDDESSGNGKNNSNNTWNEDTCSNDISFPSLSVTVPMIASANDDTTTSEAPIELNYESDDKCSLEVEEFIVNGNCSIPRSSSNLTQPDSLESDTNTLVNTDNQVSEGAINFVIGGEVHHHNLCNGNSSFESTMTNSTIIALEATKLRSDLMNMQGITNSMTSIDLDNVRPPSAMDNLSTCSYLDTVNSPLLSRKRKKSLPLGLMARRALTQNMPPGSLESINSICNLDNIKPPSLMDELLDSLISVDSIPSEVAESHESVTYQIEEMSHYETAQSELDDATTIGSCTDLVFDTTSIQSGFSSAESTPKRLESPKRILTPRQKRQTAKDRYLTYTIEAEHVHQYQFDLINDIEHEQLGHEDNSLNSENDGISDAEEMSSIRALTKKFSFLRDLNAIKTPKSKPNSQLETRLNEIQQRDISAAALQADSSIENLYTMGNGRLSDETGEENEMPRSKPKIVKSENENSADECNLGETKVVRGRKKPTYVSPYKMVAKETKTVTKSNVIAPKSNGSPKKAEVTKQTASSNNTNKMNVTKPPVLTQKSNTPSKISSIRSKYLQPKVADKTVKKVNTLSTEDMTQTSENPKECQSPLEISPLQRQGTFTKDEPTCSDVPIVYSEPVSPAKLAKSKSGATVPKGNSFISKLKIPLKRSVSYVTSPKTSIIKNRLSQPSTPSPSTAGQQHFYSRTPGSTSRSNSNLSSKPGTPGSQPLSRSSSTLSNSNPKREVSSRIASLWKKSDTSSKRAIATNTAANQRKTNMPASTQKVSVFAKKPAPPAPGESKLIRSTTFDNTPPVKPSRPPTTPCSSTAKQSKFGNKLITTANLSVGTKKLSIVGSLVNV